MRRLLLLVVVVDLIGAAALAHAVTHPATPHARKRFTSTVAFVPHPTDPLTETRSTASNTTDPVTSTTAGRSERTTAALTKPRRRRRRKTASKLAETSTAGCSFSLSGARHAVRAEIAAGYRVGFALVTSTGRTIANVDENTPNYGASITKAMLLVAYLHDHAAQGLDPTSVSELTSMIEVSDNESADWVYAHLNSPTDNVEGVAEDAGMTGFHLNLSDPVYTLGQSLVTAHDFAQLFAHIRGLMPSRYRNFGMTLLARVQERVGLLAAGLPGTVYSKEGWKPEDDGLPGAPYIVNQAGRFSCDRVTYGMAVTVGHAADQSAGEAVVQRIAQALMDH